MEAEEFQEADILWPDSEADDDKTRSLQVRRSSRAKKRSSSQPREISKGLLSHSWTQGLAVLDVGDSDVDSDIKGLKAAPPRVLIARRRAGEKMSFSVQVGNGRTLKGRDQRQVRDAVHRMTGFLERQQQWLN